MRARQRRELRWSRRLARCSALDDPPEPKGKLTAFRAASSSTAAVSAAAATPPGLYQAAAPAGRLRSGAAVRRLRGTAVRGRYVGGRKSRDARIPAQ